MGVAKAFCSARSQQEVVRLSGRLLKTNFALSFGLLLTFSSIVVAQDSSNFSPHSSFQHLLPQALSGLRPAAAPVKEPKEPLKVDPRVRSHQEGISQFTTTTIAPINLNVSAGVGVVGSLKLSTRRESRARWFFVATDIAPDQNLFDSKGRAVLVKGNLICQMAYRASLDDLSQAGLTLRVGFDVGSVGGSVYSEISQEKTLSNFVEQEDFCPLGEVDAFTTKKEIDEKCRRNCLNRIAQTLKQDVEARLASFHFSVDTPLCSKDSQCWAENTDWTSGRCVLARDPHGSYISECSARSSLGGACPGKGSRKMFEHPCDKGLTCMKVHSSTSFWDYNRYECRDPKNWKAKGPLPLRLREARIEP